MVLSAPSNVAAIRPAEPLLPYTLESSLPSTPRSWVLPACLTTMAAFCIAGPQLLPKESDLRTVVTVAPPVKGAFAVRALAEGAFRGLLAAAKPSFHERKRAPNSTYGRKRAKNSYEPK